ncbi:hypothetical protein [Clostridium thermobutyricum]|uniref:hypothetical protein n=1 Tax=Clostridium thermobutyricum TaxID=29372 RepID=UPI002943EEBE|nr:hypothetical protein [Clostridium thermobutyricum]
MKRKLILLSTLIAVVIIGICYLYRNDYYKGDLYYIEKLQKQNYIQYNNEIPTPEIIKTINYNNDLKIIFWEDKVKGVTCSIVEHFDRKWVCVGSSGFGEVRLNNLSYIEYKPLNYKLPNIYIWNSIISDNFSKIVFDNEHVFNSIKLKDNKNLIYYISKEAPANIPNYVPIISFYNNDKLIKEFQSYEI